jgi:hypothetical protein
LALEGEAPDAGAAAASGSRAAATTRPTQCVKRLAHASTRS